MVGAMFGPAQSDELLLVHRAILEEIEGKVQTVARGRRVFPYARVAVTLVSADADRRALYQTAFGEAPGSRYPRDAECGSMRDAARISPWKSKPPKPATGRSRSSTGWSRPKAVRDPPAGAPGRGSRQNRAGRIRAGKAAHQYRPHGRVDRRRAARGAPQRRGLRGRRRRGQRHGVARSTRTSAWKTGDYRICDDGSEFGTRVFRDGRPIEVPSGNRRGEKLRPGDEIYLGRACLRFER